MTNTERQIPKDKIQIPKVEGASARSSFRWGGKQKKETVTVLIQPLILTAIVYYFLTMGNIL